MPLRVLTWNLKHGRSVPSAGRDLLTEFADALARWDWDVALLQETPPWWPATLATRLGADQRLVLTSRNSLLPVRRAIAVRHPDLVKSNGGSCNAILTRRSRIIDHRTRMLGRLPERRWVHGVRLADPHGAWFCNLHTEAKASQGQAAAATALGWAAGAPAVLGGDFNVRALALDGFVAAAEHGVDYVFVHGMRPAGEAAVLDRGHLSDHAPVLASVG